MMKNKKLFIVGGAYLQLPAIVKAKELGLQVAVADYDSNAVGISYADKYYNVSTIDELGIYEAAKDFRANGIITLATDMPMRAIAYSCERLGLKSISYETAIKSTNKGEMIKSFEAHGVAHPWYFIIKDLKELNNIEGEISFPCICKPIDSSGSRGVTLINGPEELETSVLYSLQNSRSKGVIIEEYMSGNEVSVEVMVLDGEVQIIAVTDKVTTGAPHFVEIRHSQPSLLSKKDIDRIKELAAKAVLAVGIKNGPAHVEIMLTEDGPKIIELGARLGGDFISTHLVPLSTGIDLVEAVINLACENEVDLRRKFKKGSCIRYITGDKGIIKKIEGLEFAKKIDGIHEVKMLKGVGECSENLRNSNDRLGYIIAQGSSAKEAINISTKALECIRIETKN